VVAADWQTTRQDSVAKAVEFLRSTQAENGAWSAETGPAVTALVAASLLDNGYAPADPLVSKAVDFVLTFQQPDGGIYTKNSSHRNYETCIAVMSLSKANVDGKYDTLLKKADAFLKGLQWDDDEGHTSDSTSYGGAGYGSHSRPDLSNTSFLIEALKATGNGPDDPAMQKALLFVSRCQNLESEHNTTEFAAKVNDGGFYYTPAAGGTSQAGEAPGGGLRSYASMTYAGLKSMIYAGVGPDDPRVKAALDWIRKNYSLEQNPGMGQAGLYYYYQTFSKALAATGETTITQADGTTHDWRIDLVEELASKQQPNGSWLNDTSRWMEGDPNLVTGYALLALSNCK
jgi:squalene-hopene/tetraprenyl-beta-curcumene cyclase